MDRPIESWQFYQCLPTSWCLGWIEHSSVYYCFSPLPVSRSLLGRWIYFYNWFDRQSVVWWRLKRFFECCHFLHCWQWRWWCSSLHPWVHFWSQHSKSQKHCLEGEWKCFGLFVQGLSHHFPGLGWLPFHRWCDWRYLPPVSCCLLGERWEESHLRWPNLCEQRRCSREPQSDWPGLSLIQWL